MVVAEQQAYASLNPAGSLSSYSRRLMVDSGRLRSIHLRENWYERKISFSSSAKREGHGKKFSVGGDSCFYIGEGQYEPNRRCTYWKASKMRKRLCAVSPK